MSLRHSIAALDKTPPEILAMSPEEKRDLEKKLVRRIDFTVLPSERCNSAADSEIALLMFPSRAQFSYVTEGLFPCLLYRQLSDDFC
jgi:hypothetical protein